MHGPSAASELPREADEPSLSDGRAVELYTAMLRARRLDERAVALSREGRIGLHTSSAGDEAAVVGSAFALRNEDWVFSCHRELAAALVRGVSLERCCDHLFGNERDPCKGRELPDVLAARAERITSASTLLGTHISHAVGFAWAAKIRGEACAALVYFGDSAVGSADFHNGMNFAGVFKTPCVLLCRSHAVPLSAAPRAGVADSGVAYGVPSIACDGDDALAVLQATERALARAARGEGATLVEAVRGDADGLARMRHHLSLRLGWGDGAQGELEARIAGEIDAAVARAASAPAPARATLFDDVFAELPWHLREQRAELAASGRQR